MSETLKRIEKSTTQMKRDELANMLAQCTEKEQQMFWKIYPNGPTDGKLNEAIRLVERTLNWKKEGK